jgi:actin-related protein 6
MKKNFYGMITLEVLKPLMDLINLICFNSPSVYAWEGGTMFAKDPQMKKLAVTKEDYDENGHNICFEKFDV